MRKKRVCIVVSQVDRAIAFEWTVDGLRNEFDFSFALIGKKGSYLAGFLRDREVPVYELEYEGKKHAPRAVANMYAWLRKGRFDVIHTHLVEATLYGLLPAKLLGIKKRIYTRHHSDYNYKYSPKGIKYDKLSNWLATDVIAITRQVYEILRDREHVPEHKITLIHHGVDVDWLAQRDEEAIARVREKYNRGGRSPVIGIIARQTHWKGIQHSIPAFAGILKKYPNALLVLANASGDYEKEIDGILREQLPEGSWVKIRYEYDTSSLYKIFDAFIHMPIDEVVEAFGQVYIEALAAGTPCVFTMSGIALDFIRDGENALVVPHGDSQAAERALERLLTDVSLREKIIAHGRNIVREKFSLPTFLGNLKSLYLR